MRDDPIARLSGHTVGLWCKGWGRCRWVFAEGSSWPRVALGPGEADVWITLSLSRWLEGKWPDVQGDVDVARAFRDACCAQPQTWAETWLGPDRAQQLQAIFKSWQDHASAASQAQWEHTGAWWVEHATPSVHELRAFCDAVDQLKMDLDRTEARIEVCMRAARNPQGERTT